MLDALATALIFARGLTLRMGRRSAFQRGAKLRRTRRFRISTSSTKFDPLPEFGGSQAILYKSSDGKRLAGSFRESGTHTITMPFDEFDPHRRWRREDFGRGGDTVDLKVGDCCYLRQGQKVTFEMTDDFHDVTVLISDDAFNHVAEPE